MSEDKALAEPDLSPEVVAAEINVGTIEPTVPHRGRGGSNPRVSLSQEQKDEIVKLYLTTDEPVGEIARTYAIQSTYPYVVLKQAGIDWRRGDGTPPPDLEHRGNGVARPEVVQELPEDNIKALERMLQLPTAPPKAEPIRAIQPTVPTTAPSLPQYVDEILPGELVWRVEYTGSMLVKASSIDQALERARADGHLRNVIGVTLHTR